MTVRTSAKSTFIKPGQVINSAIPCTAPSKTSFAALKAFNKLTSRPSTLNNFSLGIVIKESTNWLSSTIPSSATALRFLPSKINGRVTTATVKIPISFATWATIGAAPVPVPPPMPAVINTISEPSNTSIKRSRSSSAAWRPTSGFAPAPKPLVILLPSCNTVFAPEFFSACESVLAQINSTPSILAESICCTAFPPPPPTPITFITAAWLAASTNSNISKPPKY